jgi:hypothetical protein
MKDNVLYPAVLLAGCGKTLWARQNLTGLHVWDKPGLPGYLVCLVHLVSLVQPNKPDRPNRPNEQDRLVDFFSILLVENIHGHSIDSKSCLMRKGLAIEQNYTAVIKQQAGSPLSSSTYCFKYASVFRGSACLSRAPFPHAMGEGEGGGNEPS